MDYAIEVSDVHKSFKIHADRAYELKDYIILHKSKKRVDRRQVLKGISFRVKRGEAVSLIGRNGCGKSTTLKLLTGILRPDRGSITMQGRTASLIELGAGFHPDMTGRENVYINASIFGIKKREVDKRIDDIIRFSELEEFIDEPVRTYSSGMYMRLAFSVAINVDADILLIDEILAVGDANFQQKCFEWLRELKRKGVTIVLVSHALEQVREISDRVIWIEDGRIREEGQPELTCNHYLAMSSAREPGSGRYGESMPDRCRPYLLESFNDLKDYYSDDSSLDGKVKILSVEALNRDKPVYRPGDKMQLCLELMLKERLDEFSVRCILRRIDNTALGKAEAKAVPGGKAEEVRRVCLEADFLHMAPGRYLLSAVIYTPGERGTELKHTSLVNMLCFEIRTEEEAGGGEWNTGEWGSVSYPDMRILEAEAYKGGN